MGCRPKPVSGESLRGLLNHTNRQIIYTTNAIESLNRVIRKTTKSTRGSFPTDAAATKLIYLAIRNFDRHIATVLAGIRRKHARPPVQKEAVLAEDILDMIATLSFGLRDQRDRAILLIGYAGGLRRSEIVSLDFGRDDTEDGTGWIKIADQGLILTFHSKTGWREVEIGRGSSDQSCPVHALEQYLHYAKIDFGPLFQRVSRDDRKATGDRLSDKHVARLIKKTVLAAGIRGDLPQAERLKLFSGHSLRAGLATSANVDERYIQKQLGHASPEMTRRYQRNRDRFRVNLTKAAGL